MWEIANAQSAFRAQTDRKEDGLAKYNGDWMKRELIEERAG